MKESLFVVHWPGRDVIACAEHALKLKNLASHMGFALSVTLVPFSNDAEAVCSNCENEKKKGGAA
jgi:hypothetical protein